jgi:LysR family transcriptional regulator, glycine cleavage system transcriptional activator
VRRARALAGVRPRSGAVAGSTSRPAQRPPWLPPLNALHAFESTGRLLSIKNAAAELSVTPSAISRQIKLLEDQLGVPLFVRSNRTIALTAAGTTYLKVVNTAFSGLVEGTGALRQVSGRSVVRISLVQTLAANWLVPHLAEFATSHSDIELQTVTGDDLADVAGGEVDLAIRFGQGSWPGLRADLLLPLTTFPVAAPTLAKSLRSPHDLARHPWLHLVLYPQAFRGWLSHVGAADITAERNFTFDNAEVVFRAAEHGMGVAMATRVLVEPYLASGRLIQPFTVECPVVGGYYLVARTDLTLEPAIAEVHRWLLTLRRRR